MSKPSKVLDALAERGINAAKVVVAEVMRKVIRAARRKTAGPEMVLEARRVLARHEPLLSRVLSDAMLAAWITGTTQVTDQLPEFQRSRLPPGFEPPAPPDEPIAGTHDDEPLVRYPATEAAARDLMTRQVMTREAFDALASDAKRAAFTVARVASLDALQVIQAELVRDVGEGGTLDTFAERVEEALGSSALAPHHVETVYRTNVMTAYTQGLTDVLRDPLVSDEFPYLEYHAVHDSRARPEHLAMERLGIQGTNIYRRDDPIWELFTPPWDYNCRCAVVPLSLEDAAAKGIREAKRWLKSGIPPAEKAWVKRPPFSPPEGWTTRKMEAIL